MTDSHPLLSVLIPTRERPETLAHTLRSTLMQDTTAYEVLVSDNASGDHTQDIVAGFASPRIRYVRTNRRLSMSDNWEFALTHARGRYVMFIGDDDAILPHGVDKLIGLMETHPSRAYMWTTPIYTWPIDGRPAEITYLPSRSGPRDIDLVKMARFVIRHGGWRYYKLPGVYHAAVERDVLDAIAKQVGRVFESAQPDVFTSMCVPAITPRAVHTEHPITLHGRSARSNGAYQIAKDGDAVIQRYIREFGEYQPHASLSPVIPLHARLVIDAVLRARDAFPNLYGTTVFSYDIMFAYLCKWGLMSKSFVLTNRSRFRQSHKFNALKFLAYATAFDIANVRRRLLTRATPKGPFSRDVPADVCEFAVQYDRWARAAEN